MCEAGHDVRTWATFSDISLHGCYVEVPATYRAGTVLHMKLEANGVRLETQGNVRVSYPYLEWGLPSWKCRTKTSPGCANCWPPSLGRP